MTKLQAQRKEALLPTAPQAWGGACLQSVGEQTKWKHLLCCFVVGKGERLAHAQILFLVVHKTCRVFLNSQRAASTTSVLCLSSMAQEGKHKTKELCEQGRAFVTWEGLPYCTRKAVLTPWKGLSKIHRKLPLTQDAMNQWTDYSKLRVSACLRIRFTLKCHDL